MVSVSPNWGVLKAGVRSGYSIWGAACSLYYSRTKKFPVHVRLRRLALPKVSFWLCQFFVAGTGSCTDPCEKIVWRSCWKPPQESLPLRSWRCSALVLVWKFFWDAHRKFLYKTFLCRPFETLWGVLVWGFGMRSWWVDTALLLVLVILFHSYCCLYWYIDFLPPKLFGVSCRCIFLWGVIPTQNSIFEASNFQVIN